MKPWRNRAARRAFSKGLMERFLPACDESYEDIRRMLQAADAARFLTIK
jgi:hypothetical protein